MFHNGRLVRILDVREGMRTAPVAYKEAVALREVARIVSARKHLHQTAVTVLAAACRYALADYTASCIPACMYHLRTRIRLLEIVGHSYRIELRRRVVTLEDGRRIFPCYGGSGLHLCP